VTGGAANATDMLGADIYNVFTVGTIAQVNETWGPLWGRPQLVLLGRYVRFGTQI
jgi:hypothetical protein